ncbi:MAG: HNH endonuclease, partial [Chloroflexota bacterium]
IVSFIDNWQQAINWAEYDLLGGEDGNGKGTTNPPSLPLQLISIERVRELLLQMDRGIIVQVGPFIKLIPLGWYVVEFEAAVAGSEDTEEIKRETVAGSEDTEEIKREFVLVFEDDEKNYQGFIQWLTQVDLTKFEDTNLELEQHQRRLERWQQRFFPQKEGTAQKGLLRSLFHIARHMAQNDSAPTFFTFEARKDHDLDKVAQKFSFEDELNVRALDKALRNEHERKDRYWSTFYSTYNLFKSQYDGCVNRLLDLTHVDNGEDYIRPIGPIDELLDREPLEEVKVEVKARDGNRCCCCRESNRLEIDHVIPWYYGGPTSIDNLQTLCKICHTTKGRTSFDFRIHQTSMYVPSSDLTTFDINVTRNVMSLEEWEKFLRRSINFFYGCSVVDSIRTGNFSQWEVSLHAGNNPLWLKPYLEGLLNRINETLPSAGMGKLQGLRITAPNQPEVSTALGEVPVKAPNQPTMIGTAKAIPNQVEAHCARCKVKHLMLQPEWVTLSNGRSALKGKCSVCGATTHRFPKQGEIT